VFKKPVEVRPGRASKARRVEVGIKEFVLVNQSTTIDVVLSGVIESGRFTLFTHFRAGAERTKSENVARNDAQPNASTTKQTKSENAVVSGKSPIDPLPPLPRGDEVAKLFDPLLNASRARLISSDRRALTLACGEMGAIPFDVLVHAVMAGDSPRGARPITSPLHVWKIIKECRLNWEKSGSLPVPRVAPAKGGRGGADALKDLARKKIQRDGRL